MKFMTKRAALMILAAGLVAPAAFVRADTAVAPAGGQFAKSHPRRAQVNGRVRTQRARINKNVAKGNLTAAQGQQLKANDRAMKQQERSDVKANGGSLTKGEQKQLNQEENANSKLIKDEAHPAQ